MTISEGTTTKLLNCVFWKISPFNNHASKSQDNDENVISNGNDDNNTGNTVIGNNEDSLKDIFVNEQ